MDAGLITALAGSSDSLMEDEVLESGVHPWREIGIGAVFYAHLSHVMRLYYVLCTPPLPSLFVSTNESSACVFTQVISFKGAWLLVIRDDEEGTGGVVELYLWER